MDTYKVFTEPETWIISTDYFTYYQAFGADTVTISYTDVDRGQVVLVYPKLHFRLFKLVNGGWVSLV